MASEQSLLEIVVQRNTFRSQILANAETLLNHLNKHPRKEAVFKRMVDHCERVLSSHPKSKDGHGDQPKGNDQNQLDLENELAKDFIKALDQNLIDISNVFTEIPPSLTLCEFKKLTGWLVKHEPDQLAEVRKQYETHVDYLKNKYSRITGNEHAFSDDNYDMLLNDLLARKAPIARKPNWTTKKSSGERIDTPVGAPNLNGNAEIVDPNPSEKDCSLEDVYSLAGAARPKQPDNNTPRHTFPGMLSIGEDIYYDYSVIIPIDDCVTCGTQEYRDTESLLGLKLIAGKVREVIKVLEDWQVGRILGEADGEIVLDKLKGYLTDIESDTHSHDPIQRRRSIKKLREYASIIRSIARTELLVRNPEIANLVAIAESVLAIVNSDDIKFDLKDRILPQAAEKGDAEKSKALVPEGKNLRDAQFEDPWGNATNGYYYKRKEDNGGPMQWTHLTAYLKHLGNKLGPSVKDLMSRASELATAVTNVTAGNSAYIDQFRQILSGWINDLLLNMADLIDQMAEVLPVNKFYREESSIRLGLQVVYRQYWNPIGYVRGKLVGYKNLIPNQKESVARKTFIKTSREMTTLSQFEATRQTDYSQTQRETSDLLKEISTDFKLTTSSSGRFDVAVWGVRGETSLNAGLRTNLKAQQNMFAESVLKGSTRFNDKRETKIRQLTETENMEEVKTELHNSNAEITANYFYYQLLREYRVSVEMHDIVPVLLRTKSVPSKGEIDDHFVSRYIHLLANRLPSQLSQDALENVEEVDLLAKDLFRKRANLDQRQAEYNQYRTTSIPNPTTDQAGYNQWLEGIKTRENLLSQARQELTDVDSRYTRARSRLDRVVSHIRENRLYYMQYIWQSNSTLDEDELLQEETYCGQPLPEITRGLMRVGYMGRDEIFEYTGQSLELFEALLDRMVPGSEIAAMGLDQLKQTSLFQYMMRYYPEDNAEELLERIRGHAFLEDFNPSDEVLSERYIQVAQDALVVETMPGTIPLLEGYQMAMRMLNVQQACLENQHLRGRIEDKTWTHETAKDNYIVKRIEGDQTPK